MPSYKKEQFVEKYWRGRFRTGECNPNIGVSYNTCSTLGSLRTTDRRPRYWDRLVENSNRRYRELGFTDIDIRDFLKSGEYFLVGNPDADLPEELIDKLTVELIWKSFNLSNVIKNIRDIFTRTPELHINYGSGQTVTINSDLADILEGNYRLMETVNEARYQTLLRLGFYQSHPPFNERRFANLYSENLSKYWRLNMRVKEHPNPCLDRSFIHPTVFGIGITNLIESIYGRPIPSGRICAEITVDKQRFLTVLDIDTSNQIEINIDTPTKTKLERNSSQVMPSDILSHDQEIMLPNVILQQIRNASGGVILRNVEIRLLDETTIPTVERINANQILSTDDNLEYDVCPLDLDHFALLSDNISDSGLSGCIAARSSAVTSRNTQAFNSGVALTLASRYSTPPEITDGKYREGERVQVPPANFRINGVLAENNLPIPYGISKRGTSEIKFICHHPWQEYYSRNELEIEIDILKSLQVFSEVKQAVLVAKTRPPFEVAANGISIIGKNYPFFHLIMGQNQEKVTRLLKMYLTKIKTINTLLAQTEMLFVFLFHNTRPKMGETIRPEHRTSLQKLFSSSGITGISELANNEQLAEYVKGLRLSEGCFAFLDHLARKYIFTVSVERNGPFPLPSTGIAINKFPKLVNMWITAEQKKNTIFTLDQVEFTVRSPGSDTSHDFTYRYTDIDRVATDPDLAGRNVTQYTMQLVKPVIQETVNLARLGADSFHSLTGYDRDLVNLDIDHSNEIVDIATNLATKMATIEEVTKMLQAFKSTYTKLSQ